MAAMIQPKGKGKKIADKILKRKKDKGAYKELPEPRSTREQAEQQLEPMR